MTKLKQYQLRAEPERFDRWTAAARADGRSLNSWIGLVLDQEVSVLYPAVRDARPDPKPAKRR